MPSCQGCTTQICVHCAKDRTNATLKCPTCAQLGIPGFFCCQTCFKTSWAKHKLSHSLSSSVPEVDTGKDPLQTLFRNYAFAGRLRPSPQSPQVQVPEGIPTPDYAFSGQPESELAMGRSHHIPILNADQIQRMREACVIGRDALVKLLLAFVLPVLLW